MSVSSHAVKFPRRRSEAEISKYVKSGGLKGRGFRF